MPRVLGGSEGELGDGQLIQDLVGIGATEVALQVVKDGRVEFWLTLPGQFPPGATMCPGPHPLDLDLLKRSHRHWPLDSWGWEGFRQSVNRQGSLFCLADLGGIIVDLEILGSRDGELEEFRGRLIKARKTPPGVGGLKVSAQIGGPRHWCTCKAPPTGDCRVRRIPGGGDSSRRQWAGLPRLK